MSSAEFPSMAKRNSDAYGALDSDDTQGLINLSGLFKSNVAANVNSILKRKSDVIRAVDMSRHYIEPQVNTDGTTALSIVKRPQTVAVVSKQKMISTDIFNLSRTDKVTDVATVSGKAMARKSKRKQGNWFSDDERIQDADYREITGEIHDKMEHDPHYVSDGFRAEKSSAKKVPKRISVTKQQVEPAYIQAVSLQKRKIRNELVKAEPNKLSQRARNNRDNPNWLINEAFEQLVDTGKAIVKVAKTTGKIADKAVREGLKQTKVGLREFNEISEIVCDNPVLKQIGKVHENDMRAMASQARHARNSIAASGNNSRKRHISAGSLVTQRAHVTRASTQEVAPYPTQNQVIPKIVHRKGGDQVRYFLPTGKEVSAAVARKLLNGTVPVLPKAIEASTTASQTNPTYNTGTIAKKPAKKIINKPKIATRSKLVRRTHSGVV